MAGAATGMFISPQQAAVADIIGNKARGGTAVATFQMMADLGSIVGSLAVGQIAEHLSFGCGVRGQRRDPAGRGGRLGVRAGDAAAGRRPSRHRPVRWVQRPAAKCRDQRF